MSTAAAIDWLGSIGRSRSDLSLAPEVVETHISVLFFVGDRVLKLKKPVHLGFLDTTRRQDRARLAHAEVELNRRFSPDVYLGVLDLTDPDGKPVDHVVVMRRMPAEQRLSTLVRSGADVADGLRSLARTMAVVHDASPTSDEISATAHPDEVRSRWFGNLQDIVPCVGDVLPAAESDEVAALALRYVDGRHALFEQRIREGRIRDGHGDLLADDIYLLEDGPRVLDCIEFDAALRYGDVLADVGFLAMDLEYLGRPDLGAAFLDWYREFSAETWPASLAHHYIAYRAHVRAKIDCLRHRQGATDAAEPARRHLDLALRHLRAGRVRLVLVGGPPGTGKSTVARSLAEAGRAVLLSSDDLRKSLAGLPVDRPAPAEFGMGLYEPERVRQTYAAMLAQARDLLDHGETVVLDASWRDGRQREYARQLAVETRADLVELRCDCPEDLAGSRLRERRPGSTPSDASPEIAAGMRAATHPWPEATVLDTSGDLESTLARAREHVGFPNS